MGYVDNRIKEYSAVIRVEKCSRVFLNTLHGLRAQSTPPTEIVLVDSSRDPQERAHLAELGCKVVVYPDEPFNFSKAINLGAAAATSDWLLVISSHFVLNGPLVLQRADEDRIGNQCALFYIYASAQRVERLTVIDAKRFNGHNGLSNTCAMVPRELVVNRPFREEVFSAEDQEWSSWFFKVKRGRMLRIESAAASYLNPNSNLFKLVNEEIAIAYFTRKRELWPDRIAARVLRALLALLRGRKARAQMHWAIAKGLTCAIFKQPIRRSKYY